MAYDDSVIKEEDSWCKKEPTGINEDLVLIKKLKRDDEEKNIEARRTVEFIRPEILKVAEEMEKVMRKHDGNKGDSYKTCDISFLGGKIQEEYAEVEKEIYNFLFSSSNSLKPELIDLCNCCMMLWNRKEV